MLVTATTQIPTEERLTIKAAIFIPRASNYAEIQGDMSAKKGWTKKCWTRQDG